MEKLTRKPQCFIQRVTVKKKKEMHDSLTAQKVLWELQCVEIYIHSSPGSTVKYFHLVFADVLYCIVIYIGIKIHF